MHRPLDLEPVRIASIEERRMAQVMREVCVEHADIDGFVCGYGGAGSWQNQAISGLREQETDPESLRRIDAFYAERGVEPQVNAIPHLHPGLLDRLVEMGYRVKNVELVYAIDLERDRPAPVFPPDDVTFETVDPGDATRVDDWAHLNTRLFFGEVDHAVHVEAARRCILADRSTALIVRAGGQDVGIAGYERFEHLAALWGAAVREDHRRKGVQLALIHARLRLAQEAGCRYATIGSVAGIGTERNALRAGMRLVYPRLEMARAGEGLAPSA